MPHRALLRVALVTAPLVLGLVALAQVDPTALQRVAHPAAVPLLALAIALGALTIPLKALSWRPFVTRLDHAPPVAPMDLVPPVAVGAFLNAVLPARVGEVARVAIARRRLGGPGAPALAGSVAAEAIASLMAWGILALLLAAVVPVPGAVWLVLALAGGLLGAALVAAARPPRPRTPRGGRARRALAGAWVALLAGLRALGRPRTAAEALVPALASWTAQLAVVALVLAAMVPGQAGPGAAATVLVTLSAAQTLPLLPGAAGTAQAAVAAPLITLYGVPAADALAVALVLPLVQMLPVVGIGWAMAVRMALPEGDDAAPAPAPAPGEA
ncbi:MAG: lysylphosphatidylglycerol synthase domain-containing protein [Thermoleophilia bacterium]|jgi:hypothetical protein|nr:lysylphosphatidylglycerol synthase domain-containing protein [Thermoleophilia bacterium]